MERDICTGESQHSDRNRTAFSKKIQKVNALNGKKTLFPFKVNYKCIMYYDD